MKMPLSRLVLLGAVALLCAHAASCRMGCEIGPREGAGSAPEPRTVFAAASLADLVGDVEEAYRASGGPPLRFNFAGSNALARQIEAGADPDLFLSADLRQIERLEAAGRVDAGARLPLWGNRLVVVVPADSGDASLESPEDLRRFERLALADPEAVPAGVYAARWLRAAGVWDALEDRLIPTLDVRAALAAVAGGNADAGIVYRTDAVRESRVRVIHEVPPGSGPEIVYYGVAVSADGGAGFLDFLQGAEARALFEAHGFRPLGRGAGEPAP